MINTWNFAQNQIMMKSCILYNSGLGGVVDKCALQHAAVKYIWVCNARIAMSISALHQRYLLTFYSQTKDMYYKYKLNVLNKLNKPEEKLKQTWEIPFLMKSTSSHSWYLLTWSLWSSKGIQYLNLKPNDCCSDPKPKLIFWGNQRRSINVCLWVSENQVTFECFKVHKSKVSNAGLSP